MFLLGWIFCVLAAKNVFGRPGNCGACKAANAAPASDFVRRCTENINVKYAISPYNYY